MYIHVHYGIPLTLNLTCFSDSFRLLQGPVLSEGLVEVYVPGSGWQSVCADSFDSNDAKVICREIGYSLGGRAVDPSSYGYVGK